MLGLPVKCHKTRSLRFLPLRGLNCISQLEKDNKSASTFLLLLVIECLRYPRVHNFTRVTRERTNPPRLLQQAQHREGSGGEVEPATPRSEASQSASSSSVTDRQPVCYLSAEASRCCWNTTAESQPVVCGPEAAAGFPLTLHVTEYHYFTNNCGLIT